MFEILYLPPATSAAEDPVRKCLAEKFLVTDCESCDDATDILTRQKNQKLYAFEAFVGARDSEVHASVVRNLRWANPRMPIVFLTMAKPLAPLKAKWLSLGADDCIPIRRFSSDVGREICVTLERRILCRHEKYESRIAMGNSVMDLGSRIFECMDRVISLSPQEWSVMALLALRYPDVLSTEQLETALESKAEIDAKGVLAAVVLRLRTKLKAADSSWRIFSIRGIGYRLEARS